MTEHVFNVNDSPKTGQSSLDHLWQKKRLTAHQLLVHDIRLEQRRQNAEPRLEVRERVTAELVPREAVLTRSERIVRASDAGRNPIEQQRLTDLEEEYGWISSLRIPQIQNHVRDPNYTAKVRWIHVSSKFPAYLRGFLWALSDAKDSSHTIEAIRKLDKQIHDNERYSPHGKYFEPTWSTLNSEPDKVAYPLFWTIPFLDWSVNGAKPPLRFQVDKTEGYRSGRSASHRLRTILQHFYRLEDTRDRDKAQVFGKHQPWKTDRDLDLKVRRWFGHHPTSLIVDELWIIAVDPEHIVTFSSNQSWKSQYPPLQLASRIADISFRSIRKEYFMMNDRQSYTAHTHAIVCLSGAVGMLHRGFWTDAILPLSERFASYLGHLQYCIYRAPSTKLVIDLMQVQEELNIVVQIMRKQLDLIIKYAAFLHKVTLDGSSSVIPVAKDNDASRIPAFTNMADSATDLANNIQVELNDIQALLDNANSLVNRTVQLVNLRQEDHSSAILAFTIITIVFLPLNFVCSFFGMNVADIRNMTSTQSLFWIVAACVTAGVVSLSIFVAFNGGVVMEKFVLWKERRRRARQRRIADEPLKHLDTGFHILNMDEGRDNAW